MGPDRPARAASGRLVRHRGRREGRPVRHSDEEGQAGLRVAGIRIGRSKTGVLDAFNSIETDQQGQAVA